MKKLLSLAPVALVMSIFGFSSTAFSQDIFIDAFPECSQQNVYDLCGYTYGYISNVYVIPPQFEKARDFSEGLAAVRIEGKWGYINLDGEIVIAPIYDDNDTLGYAENGNIFIEKYKFLNGYASVRLNGLWGLIDVNGTQVLPHRFAGLSAVNHGMSYYSDADGNGLIRTNGEVVNTPPALFVYPFTEDVIIVVYPSFSGPKYGLYHIDDGWIVRPKYDFEPFAQVEFLFGVVPMHDFVWATEGNLKSDPIGLMRPDGTWQIEPIFTSVDIGRQGVGATTVAIETEPDSEGNTEKLFGAVSLAGEMVVPVEFARVNQHPDAIEVMKLDGTYGIFDFDGNLLGGQFFDNYFGQQNGQDMVVTFDDSVAILNVADNTLVEIQPDDPRNSQKALWFSCTTGIEIWKTADGYEIVDSEGVRTTPYLFDSVSLYGLEVVGIPTALGGQIRNCDRPFNVELNDKTGFVSPDGKLLSGSANFERTIRDFENGIVIVGIDEKWGVLDEAGKFVVPVLYDDIARTTDLLTATLDDDVSWFDFSGNQLTEENANAQKDANDRYRALSCGFNRESFRFVDNGLWGIKSGNGEIALEAKFRAVTCYEQGVAWAPDDQENMWCPVRPDGEWRTDIACEKLLSNAGRGIYFEEFLGDDYEGNVQWLRGILEYGNGDREEKPLQTSAE